MLMATSFLACENELPFRDKPQEPQLLMNAFLEAGKEKNEVFLHIVDGNGTTSFLEGAIIVYVNDEKTERVIEKRLTETDQSRARTGSVPVIAYVWKRLSKEESIREVPKCGFLSRSKRRSG